MSIFFSYFQLVFQMWLYYRERSRIAHPTPNRNKSRCHAGSHVSFQSPLRWACRGFSLGRVPLSEEGAYTKVIEDLTVLCCRSRDFGVPGVVWVKCARHKCRRLKFQRILSYFAPSGSQLSTHQHIHREPLEKNNRRKQGKRLPILVYFNKFVKACTNPSGI